MNDPQQNEYLKAKIMTASAEQLQMMLYDGAIRFCEQAKQAIQDKDVPTTHDRLTRAQRIVMELSSSLKPQVDQQLCGKLASLYNYVYRLLVDANLKRDVQKVEEALKLLNYQRETWSMALERIRQGRDTNGEIADYHEHPGHAPANSTTLAQHANHNDSSSGEFLGGTLSIEG